MPSPIKYCVCFKLATGGRIIGWFCIICCLTLIATAITMSVYLDQYVYSNNTDFPGVDPKIAKRVLQIEIGNIIFLSIFNIIASAVLIYAIEKKISHLLGLWLIINGITIVASVPLVMLVGYMLITFTNKILFSIGLIYIASFYNWVTILILKSNLVVPFTEVQHLLVNHRRNQVRNHGAFLFWRKRPTTNV